MNTVSCKLGRKNQNGRSIVRGGEMEGVFPGVGGGECGVNPFGLVGELVVEEFVEKDLGDDLELVAIVTEAVVGADGLEVVDELLGFGVEEARNFGYCNDMRNLNSNRPPSPARS